MTGFTSSPRRHRAAAIGLAGIGLAVLLAATGCSSQGGSPGTGALGDPVASPSGSPATSPAVSHSAATPTAAATTPAPSHTTAPVAHAYPSNYAQAILAAWTSGDSTYLALLTSAATAHQIGTFGDINQHWTIIRNDGVAGATMASYYNAAGDEIILQIENDAVGQHHWHAGSIHSWDPMTFPSSASAYTKNYVDAWIAGNTGRMNLLGTTALTGLYLGRTTPTTGYTLNPPFSTGAGEVEVEIKDTATSLDTSVIIHTATLGHSHAIGGCDIGC